MSKTNDAAVVRLWVALELMDQARHLLWLAGEGIADVAALRSSANQLHGTVMDLVVMEDNLRKLDQQQGLELEPAPDEAEECAWRDLGSAPPDVRSVTGDVADCVLRRWKDRQSAAKAASAGPVQS